MRVCLSLVTSPGVTIKLFCWFLYLEVCVRGRVLQEPEYIYTRAQRVRA